MISFQILMHHISGAVTQHEGLTGPALTPMQCYQQPSWVTLSTQRVKKWQVLSLLWQVPMWNSCEL